MSELTNIVLAGVGGQGSVTAGQIIARAAGLAGHQVVTSELHGMAQRGGSVVSTVRFGQQVYSPMVPVGEAQYLLAFEKLEGVRHLPCLRPGGIALINDQRITPSIEALKHAPYPADVRGIVSSRASQVLLVPGLQVAARLGNPRLANSVLLGALSRFLQLLAPAWRQAMSERVPPHTVELNLLAFEEGAAFVARVQLEQARALQVCRKET